MKRKPVQSLLPRGRCKRGQWVYAIGLADGRLKIGITVDIRSRISAHRMALGSPIAWVHLFPGTVLARSIEVHVCQKLRVSGKRIGSTELFQGLSKEEFIAEIRASADHMREVHESHAKRAKADGEWRRWYQAHVVSAETNAAAKAAPEAA